MGVKINQSFNCIIVVSRRIISFLQVLRPTKNRCLRIYSYRKYRKVRSSIFFFRKLEFMKTRDLFLLKIKSLHNP